VGACHVNTITILGQGLGQPPRLTVGAACDECNVCVLVCPTGALTSSTGPLPDWRRR
jgi:ferredoxin